MKRFLKNTQLRNALLLSMLLHFILILIWGVPQVQPPIGEVELSIQVEIDRDCPKPPLRPLKRPLYSPRVPTVAKEKLP